MRKLTKVNTEAGEIIVKEFILQEILNLMDEIKKKENVSMQDFIETCMGICTGMKKEDMLKMSFSDIEALVLALKEVNKSFFLIPDHLGMEQVIRKMVEEFKNSMLSVKILQVGNESSKQ